MRTKEALNIRKKFTTTLDEKIIRDLKLLAIQQQTDANKIIERLIEEYLKKQEEKRQ